MQCLKIILTFITRDSEEPVSAHINKGVNINVNTGTSILTRGTATCFCRSYETNIFFISIKEIFKSKYGSI